MVFKAKAKIFCPRAFLEVKDNLEDYSFLCCIMQLPVWPPSRGGSIWARCRPSDSHLPLVSDLTGPAKHNNPPGSGSWEFITGICSCLQPIHNASGSFWNGLGWWPAPRSRTRDREDCRIAKSTMAGFHHVACKLFTGAMVRMLDLQSWGNEFDSQSSH